MAGIEPIISRHAGDAEFILGAEACLEAAPTLDVLMANLMPDDFLLKARSLKALFVPFVGINHLPTDLLQQRNISVYNCHGNAFSVAERALALTLAGFGRVVEYHNDLKSGHWHGFWAGKGAEDFWRSLHGKSCTILGTGAIGMALASLLKAFKCSVRGFRRNADGIVPANFDSMHTDLREALTGADVVYVALPLTKATKNLLGERELAWMEGAWLVNVGRGEIVAEEALYAALRFGKLAGASIDVWYKYPKAGSDHGHPSNYPLDELPNIVLSPHVGGSTAEAVLQNIQQSCENLSRFIKTGEALHRVDLKENY